MAETGGGPRRRRRWTAATVAGVAVLVLGAVITVQLMRQDMACGCVNPDAGLDVTYGLLGPGDDTVRARLEVVEVAAMDGHTRTVLNFSHSDDEHAVFDPAYFVGGDGTGDGFRIWDPVNGRLYENQTDLGTVTGGEQVWEPRTQYEIVLFSAPLEPGTGELEVRGPHGEIRIPDVEVRGGAGDTEPLWSPQGAQNTESAQDEEEPERVPLDFATPAPETDVPGYAQAFVPDAPEPVDPVPTEARTDEEGWARFEEAGVTWRMSVEGYEVQDGVLTLEYRLEAEGADNVPDSQRRPDLFPEELTLIDPATGAVVPRLRVGDSEAESEPLWSIAWPGLSEDTPMTFGELAFTAPPEGAGDLLLDAGVFGALPVEPRG
ncbi:hypothetical protein [Nocardiopsis sp. Huas11]|uniref:hypothetical protein n=1 Tax=Nocardiopsis sp. Huas11 TaxID=2183912 RepID=UPI000EB00259|nr:hypothetical protein [Nocardiopsis sp. Huas11]